MTNRNYQGNFKCYFAGISALYTATRIAHTALTDTFLCARRAASAKISMMSTTPLKWRHCPRRNPQFTYKLVTSSV